MRAVMAAALWTCLGGAYAAQTPVPAPTASHPGTAPSRSDGPAPSADTAISGQASFELWTGGRYRITPSDVISLVFPYVPEFDQVVTVQPDGYVQLRGLGDVRVQSRTLPELRELLTDAYGAILKNPTLTLSLKEFEKPYFVAAGEVRTPGKFELRGATTVTQALALAGGLTGAAKHSQVILFRRFSDDLLEVQQVDVGKMFATKDLSTDYVLRPGDTLFVPKSLIARIQPFIPSAGLGFYVNPFSR